MVPELRSLGDEAAPFVGSNGGYIAALRHGDYVGCALRRQPMRAPFGCTGVSRRRRRALRELRPATQSVIAIRLYLRYCRLRSLMPHRRPFQEQRQRPQSPWPQLLAIQVA